MLSNFEYRILFVIYLTSYSWLPWSALGQWQGIYFQLNGVNYSNNSDSEIAITDIGSSDEESLLCFTDNPECCGYMMGEWYFPNMSLVKIEGMGESFYRNRGPRVIRLHRRHNATMPAGEFCCKVPDVSGVTQTACIMIVNTSESEINTTRGNEQSTLPLNFTTSATTTTTTATSGTTTVAITADITTTEPQVSSTTPTKSPPEIPDCSFTEPTGVGIFLNGSWVTNNSISVKVTVPSSATQIFPGVVVI